MTKTHLESGNIFGARADLSLGQPLGEVERLLHLLGAALDLHSEEGSGESRSIRVKRNALALELSARDGVDEGSEGPVHRSGVHVAELLRGEGRGLGLGLEEVLRGGDESLLDLLVEESLGAGEVLEVGGDVGETLGGGVREVVVVQL